MSERTSLSLFFLSWFLLLVLASLFSSFSFSLSLSLSFFGCGETISTFFFIFSARLSLTFTGSNFPVTVTFPASLSAFTVSTPSTASKNNFKTQQLTKQRGASNHKRRGIKPWRARRCRVILEAQPSQWKSSFKTTVVVPFSFSLLPFPPPDFFFCKTINNTN